MATLRIENLHAEVEGKEILKGINLTISSNETVALLGPNGHGKSTLLNVLMGHPKYVVTKGSVTLDGKNVLELSTDERARLGLFLAMQNPSEVPGVINSDFLRAAVNARNEKPISTYNFYKMLNSATQEVHMPFDLAGLSIVSRDAVGFLVGFAPAREDGAQRNKAWRGKSPLSSGRA